MILVFAGAGGSFAVDEKQYPTTVEFFKRLPKEITDESLFPKVCQFIKDRKGGAIDIEDMLGALGDIQEIAKKIGDPKNIMAYAMRGGLGPIGGYGEFTSTQEAIRTWERDCVTPLKDKINEQVYKFYGALPTPEKLVDWIRLLQGLQKLDPAIEIFTTNYDLVLEEAIELGNINVEWGLVHNRRRVHLEPSFWENPEKLQGGLLTKLHGSVDWQRLNGDIIVGTHRYSGAHRNHCILYPGHKGTPTEEPFVAFHKHLQNVVRQKYGPLSAALFIGYAFRDDHINTILAELSSEIPVYVIHKIPGGDIPDPTFAAFLPFSATVAEDGSGLDDGAVARCLSYLSDKIRVADEQG